MEIRRKRGRPRKVVEIPKVASTGKSVEDFVAMVPKYAFVRMVSTHLPAPLAREACAAYAKLVK